MCACVSIVAHRLIVEEGGFLYDSDAYNDDLPFWNLEHGKPHLVIPYTLDVNDMRFATPQGFNSGDQFFAYLRDSLDFLLEVRLCCVCCYGYCTAAVVLLWLYMVAAAVIM